MLRECDRDEAACAREGPRDSSEGEALDCTREEEGPSGRRGRACAFQVEGTAAAKVGGRRECGKFLFMEQSSIGGGGQATVGRDLRVQERCGEFGPEGSGKTLKIVGRSVM